MVPCAVSAGLRGSHTPFSKIFQVQVALGLEQIPCLIRNTSKPVHFAGWLPQSQTTFKDAYAEIGLERYSILL